MSAAELLYCADVRSVMFTAVVSNRVFSLCSASSALVDRARGTSMRGEMQDNAVWKAAWRAEASLESMEHKVMNKDRTDFSFLFLIIDN